MEYFVTTFYKFTSLPEAELASIKEELEKQAHAGHILGLVLLAPEGINATIAGGAAAIAEYKKLVSERFGQIVYKDSLSQTAPFKRFKVKIKPEIVQLKRTDIQPQGNEASLSPEEWDKEMQADAIVIDVRNWYEAKLGTFKNAINPQTETFSEFPQWLKKSGIPKQKKIGLFCTGGIRVAKAAVVMKEQGYEHVYQLEGGILNYLAQRPNKNFEGECFVFDHRSAVGQDLRPSQQYKVCPHCGNGGSIEKTCAVCQAAYKVCPECVAALPAALCSKNCCYQYSHR